MRTAEERLLHMPCVHLHVGHLITDAGVLEQESDPVARLQQASLARGQQRKVKWFEGHDVVQRNVEVARPGRDIALLVQRALEIHRPGWALGRARCLVFAHPLHADRGPHQRRNQRSISSRVLVTIAAIATGAFKIDASNLVPWQPDDRRNFVDQGVRGLRRGPYRQLAVLDARDGARRPRRGVRLHGEVIARLHLARRSGKRRLSISDFLRHVLLGQFLAAPVVEHGRLVGQPGTRAPLDLRRAHGPDSTPLGLCHHCQEVSLAHGTQEALHLACFAVVERHQRRTQVIGADDAGVQHARQTEVVHIREFATHFGGNVHTRDRLAHHLVFARLLRDDFLVHLQGERLHGDKLGIGQFLRRIGAQRHHAVQGDKVGGRRAESGRGTFDQGSTRGCTGTTQLGSALGDSQIGARNPLVRRGAGVAHHEQDALERDIKLLRRDLCERSARAGAEIDLADVDRDAAVRTDGNEALDEVLRNGLPRVERTGCGLRGSEPEADNERTSGKRRAGEEVAAAGACAACGVGGDDGVHGVVLLQAVTGWPEARCTARTMRWCVPQRHRFMARPSRICCSVGLGVFFNRSAACMIIPLMQ